VWYDEHNLGSGQLMTVIQRELGSRPVFIVILTKATFASRWMRRETLWAYELGDRDPTRILLPVTAGPIARSDFSAENEWLFLHDFKRIEAPGYQPYPQAEAVSRTLHALQLTLPGEAPLSTGPLPADSVADLIGRGRALNAQAKYAEALPLFQRALERDPRAFDAWLTAGYTLGNLGRYEEALVALDRALALNPNSARAWSNKGAALNGLRRYEEELAAYNRALALDPQYAKAWGNKGYALLNLKRYPEALAAYDRALALDPNEADAWSNKGLALLSLNRSSEALVAFDRALALDPDDAVALSGKGSVFHELARNGRQAAPMGERAITPAMWARHIVRNVNTTVFNLVLIALLVSLLLIPVYIVLQRVGQLTPTTTPHATPVPKHEPTPEVAAGFTGFEPTTSLASGRCKR
jgi:tetratricopeptide (TPR) repeat protein